MGSNQKIEIPQVVTEESAEWFATLKQEPIAEAKRRAFVDWLMRSPIHVEEFLRVSALSDHLSSELKSQPAWLDDVITEAGSNVVNLTELDSLAVVKTDNHSGRRWSGMKMAAAIACLAILAGVVAGLTDLIPGNNEIEEIATVLGEQRSLLLDDGSIVQLNTDSRVQISMSSEIRQVKLSKGEAIFHVAKDSERPFRVDSGSAMVEAIGTSFNVYRKEEQVVVTVVEGLIAVSPVKTAEAERNRLARQDKTSDTKQPGSEYSLTAQKPESILQLEAGHQVAVSNDGLMSKTVDVNLERVTAWTQRRLVFDNDTLVTVVDEFNRYNREALIIIDPVLQTRRITGIFNANDLDAFLALLNNLEAIRVNRDIDGSRKLSRLAFQR